MTGLKATSVGLVQIHLADRRLSRGGVKTCRLSGNHHHYFDVCFEAKAVTLRIAGNALCRRQQVAELCQYRAHKRVTELTDG